MFFRTSTQSLEKRQSMMPLFEFPEHIPEKFVACARDDITRWNMDDSGSDVDALQVICGVYPW